MTITPRILIVDDEWLNRELIQAYLDGYECLEAETGAQALKMVESHAPDLVLLDIRLPDMDGQAVCRALRLTEAGKHVPVLVISGMDDKQTRQKALEAGVDDFIAKPFDGLSLQTRIENLIRIKRLHDELAWYKAWMWEMLVSLVGETEANRLLSTLDMEVVALQ